MVALCSTIFALFLQQSGWLCHDILHHQVFKDRNLGHLLGLVWGNFAQGFSVMLPPSAPQIQRPSHRGSLAH